MKYEVFAVLVVYLVQTIVKVFVKDEEKAREIAYKITGGIFIIAGLFILFLLPELIILPLVGLCFYISYKIFRNV